MRNRKLRKEVKLVGSILIALFFIIHYAWYIQDLNERREREEQLKIQELINENTGCIELYAEDVDTTRITDVYFTNYHLGDGSSGTITASGLQIKDFEVNDDGMYTYNGKVVVATANMSRLTKGIAEGYKTHDLYEEFTIRLMNKEYQAVVLDVCGACYYMEGEFLQRYDIFVPKNILGKVIGQVVIGDNR